jgi:hypothetical protein
VECNIRKSSIEDGGTTLMEVNQERVGILPCAGQRINMTASAGGESFPQIHNTAGAHQLKGREVLPYGELVIWSGVGNTG